MDFMAEMAQRFIQELPESLDRIRKALEQGKREELARAAHYIKSGIGIFAAESAFNAATALETLAGGGDLAAAPGALAALEREVERLTQELSALLEQSQS